MVLGTKSGAVQVARDKMKKEEKIVEEEREEEEKVIEEKNDEQENSSTDRTKTPAENKGQDKGKAAHLGSPRNPFICKKGLDCPWVNGEQGPRCPSWHPELPS